ncbi:MAG: 5'/3'-nucleotidase SurE [Anaerovoracaceae bacterium]
MKNILVVNDDGIKAQGIYKLVETLSSLANVYVAAPKEQKSAAGHGITIAKPIYIAEVEYENAIKAIEVGGTPADCVKIGEHYYRERGIKFDFVYSGINHGGNLGTDTIYSGTVAGAVEGILCNIPAVSVSINYHKSKIEHFDFALDLIKSTYEKISKNLDSSTVLNINIPHLPKKEIKGVKITKLGRREYYEEFEPFKDNDGNIEYYYRGGPLEYDSKDVGIDVIADQEKYASISPISYFLTKQEAIPTVKRWIEVE